MIKVIQIERDQSSDEELSKHYEQAMETESLRVREPSPDPNLGMLTGPKIFVKVWFHPSEFKPYSLDCMIDSGCQVNLAKGLALAHFYWENTSDKGSAIEGTPVPLKAKYEIFQYSSKESMTS